jgi:pheromone shutdown protein TraB
VNEFASKGFVFYVEAITELERSKFNLDTLYAKKFRKLTEIDLTIRYSMSENLLLQKLKTKYKLIDQPKYDSFGMKNFKRVDLNYTELVDGYENKFEKIILDSCDLRTDLGKRYNCQKSNLSERKNFRNELIFKARNKLITDSVLNSDDKKIVIVYGKMHLDGIKELLANRK